MDAWVEGQIQKVTHAYDPYETTTRFFDAYAEFVFGFGDRDAMRSCGVPETDRIKRLMTRDRLRFVSEPIVYEVPQRDVDETFSTGMMTNAVFNHVLTHLRKIKNPSIRVCNLEDFFMSDFVSLARGECERAITEILSSTSVYSRDDAEYQKLYKRVHDYAMMRLDDLTLRCTPAQRRRSQMSLHIDGEHEIYVCPFLASLHYVLLVVDFTHETIYAYDSLRGRSTNASDFETTALAWLSKSPAFDRIKSFDVEIVPVAPQGINECGFAVCVFMRQWVTGEKASDTTYKEFKETLRRELVR